MLDRIWDETAALGTAPIFDDAVYLSEALGLPINQNEDHLDAELALLARESGIPDPYRFVPPPKTISRAISTMTLDSDQRSSRSIHSQETQSTSFTSAPSRTSRDYLFSSDGSTTKRVPTALPQPTCIAENPTTVAERPECDFKSRQSSTLSIAPSVVSSSTSSRQAHSRKKRSSAIFSMFRRDSGYVRVSEYCNPLAKIFPVALALRRPHTMDTTASHEAQSWHAVTRCLTTIPARIYRRRQREAHMLRPSAVEA